MKRSAIVLLANLCVAATLVAAQDKPTTPPASQDKDVSLTGCLIQGSSPSVFLLDNARANPQEKTEKGRTYVLSGPAGDTEIARNVNHEVMVIGSVEAKVPPTPPAGQQVQEKDLPKLTAKSVTAVADTCTSTVR